MAFISFKLIIESLCRYFLNFKENEDSASANPVTNQGFSLGLWIKVENRNLFINSLDWLLNWKNASQNPVTKWGLKLFVLVACFSLFAYKITYKIFNVNTYKLKGFLIIHKLNLV